MTRHSSKADEYLDALNREMLSRAKYFGSHKVTQLHFGGGTPSFLSIKQLTVLMDDLHTYFEFDEQAEISIEVDPRRIDDDYPQRLAEIGFNRISFGVQDTNIEVQEAINRVQDTDFIRNLVQQSKQAGFKSVNLDLVYGLPHQSPAAFDKTLQDAIEMDPHRISLFSYAHLPDRFAAQRKIKTEWLPEINAKFALFRQAIETLTQAGYVFVGMDHFAKPDDELAIAQQEGRLQRNFQGYTTGNDGDLLGLGLSAISKIGNALSQNFKTMAEYYESVDCYCHALERGVTLNQDDQLRGAVISQLMCNLYLKKQTINQRFDIDFDQYFEKELASLRGFEEDNLIKMDCNEIAVAPQGRLLIRNICMHFDAYLNKDANRGRFSRVI